MEEKIKNFFETIWNRFNGYGSDEVIRSEDDRVEANVALLKKAGYNAFKDDLTIYICRKDGSIFKVKSDEHGKMLLRIKE